MLVRTGRDAFYAQPDYMVRGPGRDRRGDALAVRPRRARDGHRRLGLGRAAAPAGRGGERERDEPGIFWAAHQADLPYSQIERLVNLGRAAADRLHGRVLPAEDRRRQRRAGARRGDRRLGLVPPRDLAQVERLVERLLVDAVLARDLAQRAAGGGGLLDDLGAPCRSR